MLEAIGYIVLTHTHADWVVTTPEGKDMIFKRDKRVCTGMPYIDLREQKEDLVMIELVQKIWEVTLQSRSKGLSWPG